MSMKTIASSAGGFQLETAVRFQLSDGPNNGATTPLSMIPVMLPDPNSAFAGAGPGTSQFITSNVGANWTVQVYPIVNGVVSGTALAIPQQIPVGFNIYWIPLDPAVFTQRMYRVVIRDPGNNVAEQFDFAVFDHSTTASGGSVSAINDKIRRIAGLLGFRQRVTYAQYLHGIAREALIEMLSSDLSTVVARWRHRKVLDAAGNVTAETSAALDSNDLGTTFP